MIQPSTDDNEDIDDMLQELSNKVKEGLDEKGPPVRET